MIHKKLLLGLALTAGVVPGLALAAPADAVTTTSIAHADSFASKASSARNYGSAGNLVVDGRPGSKKVAFVSFRVPAGPHADRAWLRLKPRVSSAAGVRVHAANTRWSEKSISWRNQPRARSLAGVSGPLTRGVPTKIRLQAPALAPGTEVTFRITTTARKAVRFASTEAPRRIGRPALVQRVRATSGTPTTTAVTSTAPAPSSFPAASAVGPKIIGMSAPANLWDQRIAEVGANGVKARRIFATLSSSGSSSLPLIKRAIADGMMPVISYKVPSVAAMINGDYDTWLATLRAQLVALNANVTATFWHEPRGDMAPADFRAASLKFFNIVDAPSIAVGPILNGWLLDNRVAEFASYTDATLLNKWEFVAVDSYQSGTPTSPGTSMPARAVPLLENWMDSVGHPDTPLGVGEYNGFSAKAIADAGETLLSTPEVWFGLAWNSTGGTYAPLTGDRITAFQKTKADSRAKH